MTPTLTPPSHATTHGGVTGIAVVIPCFRVKAQILSVLEAIGPEVTHIVVVDDACPEKSGAHVRAQCRDPRVVVIEHEVNRGVGGATCTGYRHALTLGVDVLVKVDGDGQMDPRLLPALVLPIAEGRADYTKGNRFYDPAGLRGMPPIRLLGNAALSFLSKLSTGYWQIFDPTNGFTALHAAVARRLPLGRISPRFFFETDLLYRLNTLRAAVVDVPMAARYGDESSNLRPLRALVEFGVKHVVNCAKRIGYNYFLRDFNVGTLELLFGIAGFFFGLTFGLGHWYQSFTTETAATTGTVMLAAVPVIVGTQLLLAFLAYDIQNTPRQAIHRMLAAAWHARGEPTPDPS